MQAEAVSAVSIASPPALRTYLRCYPQNSCWQTQIRAACPSFCSTSCSPFWDASPPSSPCASCPSSRALYPWTSLCLSISKSTGEKDTYGSQWLNGFICKLLQCNLFATGLKLFTLWADEFPGRKLRKVALTSFAHLVMSKNVWRERTRTSRRWFNTLGFSAATN